MFKLDDLQQIKRIDKQSTLDSIKKLPDQCRQAWVETQQIVIPKPYHHFNKIVIAGMGGSSYGARIVKSLYDGAEITKFPIELANDYWLPGYTDEQTLDILSSYSGSTEETLSCAKQALEKKAKIIGLTAGGDLGEFLEQNKFPAYIFRPVNNPSGQPRIGFGYLVIGLISLLAKLGIIPVAYEEIDKLITYLQGQETIFSENAFFETNPAKQMATKLQDKMPILVVADFLSGAAYASRNMFHETAKQFAQFYTIPELNHHLLEGLSNPKDSINHLVFILADSQIYDARNRQRMEITKDVFLKNNLSVESIKLNGYSAFTQSMELMQFIAWVSFYLAVLHEVDPAAIPWVNYFKKKLTEGSS